MKMTHPIKFALLGLGLIIAQSQGILAVPTTLQGLDTTAQLAAIREAVTLARQAYPKDAWEGLKAASALIRTAANPYAPVYYTQTILKISSLYPKTTKVYNNKLYIVSAPSSQSTSNSNDSALYRVTQGSATSLYTIPKSDLWSPPLVPPFLIDPSFTSLNSGRIIFGAPITAPITAITDVTINANQTKVQVWAGGTTPWEFPI